MIPLENKASKCVIGCVFQHFHIIKISLGKGERERERETENWLPSCPCSCPGWVFYLSPVQGGHTDSRACIPSSWQFVEQCRHSSYINCMWESPIHLPTVYLQLNRLTEVLSKPALILWSRSTNSVWMQPLLLFGFLLPELSMLVSTAQPRTSETGFPSLVMALALRWC